MKKSTLDKMNIARNANGDWVILPPKTFRPIPCAFKVAQKI